MPVRDDWARLESPDHWLGWLPEPAGQAIRAQLPNKLAGQVPGSVLEWVKVIVTGPKTSALLTPAALMGAALRSLPPQR